MSDRITTSSGDPVDSGDDRDPVDSVHDRDLAVLLRDAGPPAEVPAEHLAELRAVTSAEWKRRWGTPAGSRSWMFFAAAAAIGGVVMSLVALRSLDRSAALPAAGPVVAQVEIMTGIGVAARGFESRALAPGLELSIGETLEISSGVAALRLRNGLSLRVREGSRVELLGPSTIRLEAGSIYADSGEGQHSKPMIHVVTDLGTATDIGTRFVVRRREGRLEVLVREGRVQVDAEGRTDVAEVGQTLRVSGDGSLSIEPIPTWGDEWDWILAAAPPLQDASPTLQAYLDWVARETGWDIQLPANVDATDRLGGLNQMRPDLGLENALAATGLVSTFKEGTLSIESPADER